MKIDCLVAEIGSTTTVVNAFNGIHTVSPTFVGQGFSPTTVVLGDVTTGLQSAIDALKKSLDVTKLEIKETFACSSAAGGLKMSVHGLVHDMTVKAAKEAALGAGANLHYVTSGILSAFDIEKIKTLKLNIIMIAGGVDFGETRTALENADKIAELKLNIPVIYAGNIQNRDAIRSVFEKHRQKEYLFIAPNVYPRIDQLDVTETRKIIQSVFEENITKAPGMEKVRNIIEGAIIPVPGAVMEATNLLAREIGDLVTVDIGGATTDVHSATDGSEEIKLKSIAPEPFSKRTVEGDLGLYINKDSLIESVGKAKLMKTLKIDETQWQDLMDHYEPIPDSRQTPLTELLAYHALSISMKRHSGRFINIFGTSGMTRLAEGKDLTRVKYLIGTGGALTRLPSRIAIIERYLNEADDLSLKPAKTTKILIDKQYIMATLGVLSLKYPEAALTLLKASLGL
jgi:uncharacterized protein (TIGR01319 family)